MLEDTDSLVLSDGDTSEDEIVAPSKTIAKADTCISMSEESYEE